MKPETLELVRRQLDAISSYKVNLMSRKQMQSAIFDIKNKASFVLRKIEQDDETKH